MHLAYPLGTRLKPPHGFANALIFPHAPASTPDPSGKAAEAFDIKRLIDNNLREFGLRTIEATYRRAF